MKSMIHTIASAKTVWCTLTSNFLVGISAFMCALKKIMVSAMAASEKTSVAVVFAVEIYRGLQLAVRNVLFVFTVPANALIKETSFDFSFAGTGSLPGVLVQRSDNGLSKTFCLLSSNCNC